MGVGISRDVSGVRVLGVREGGPCSNKIFPIVDFIIGIQLEGSEKIQNKNFLKSFQKTLLMSQGSQVTLCLYNILNKNTRNLHVIPNSHWPNATDLLGIVYRQESIF